MSAEILASGKRCGSSAGRASHVRRSVGVVVRACWPPRCARSPAAAGRRSAPVPGTSTVSATNGCSSRQPLFRFPAWETERSERIMQDEVYGERLAHAQVAVASRHTRLRGPRARGRVGQGSAGLAGDAGCVVVTSIQSLLQPTPAVELLETARAGCAWASRSTWRRC